MGVIFHGKIIIAMSQNLSNSQSVNTFAPHDSGKSVAGAVWSLTCNIKLRHQVIEKMSYDRKKELVAKIEEKNKIREQRYEKTASLIEKETFSVSSFQRIPYLYDYLCLHFPSLFDNFP